MINFTELQAIYKTQMDQLLSPTGLTTKCLLNFGTTKKNLCINCVYDPILKKSANKYKTGGPRPFIMGMVCPYCKGAGFYGNTQVEEVYLAVIWDYKDWLIKPINVENAKGMVQTICDRTLFHKIRQCENMTVVYTDNTNNPLFELLEEPNPAGLGDNNYLISTWKRIGVSSITSDMVTV